MGSEYFEHIGNLYCENVVPKTREQYLTESETVGTTPDDSFPQAGKDADTGKYFQETGPEAAENFTPSPNDVKKKKNKESAYNEEDLSQPVGNEKSTVKAVKKESNEINNSSMKKKTKQSNKSTFDRLFEDVMREDFDDLGGGPDLGGMDDEVELGGDDEFGGEEEEVTVSLELPRALAEQLLEVLQGAVGGEEEIEDMEDVEGEEFGEDQLPESHVDLQAVPDSVSKLAGMNNKVGGTITPSGGTADSSATGQGGDGSPQKAPEGFNYAKTKNNKVGGKVTGGNKDMFKV